MKKIFFILVLNFLCLIVNSQQLPHYTMYMLNEVVVNPAALSLEKENKITLMLRDQWGSFEGAPSTYSISYNHLNHKKYKRGISVMNDVTGPISNLSATLSGAYSFNIDKKDKISLGASASIMQYKIDNSQITLEDDGVFDPALFGGVDKATGSSLSIGAYYYNPKYYLGISLQNLLGSSLNVSENVDNNKLEDHYFLNGGVKIPLANNHQIIPSLMLKKFGSLPIQFDLNLRGVYDNFLWGGLSYRTGDAIAVLFGIDYQQSSFGYSYDITTSTMRVPSIGTHGLVYSYRFNPSLRDRDNDGILDPDDACIDTPGTLECKGCNDTDGDGICDPDDICPDEYGLTINNGCPDMDGDGIVDYKDTCINVPGLPQFNGCPDTDGDGLQDKYDSCIYEPGPPQNKGCPLAPPKVDTVYIIKVDTVYITKTREILKTDTIAIPIGGDLKMAFKNVKFDTDKYSLKQISKDILDKVAEYMKKKSNLYIKLTGHTDNQNTDQYNIILSKNRVNTVQDYLVSKGVDVSRISIDWKGESMPISDNNTSKGREENRRVEIEILDK